MGTMDTGEINEVINADNNKKSEYSTTRTSLKGNVSPVTTYDDPQVSLIKVSQKLNYQDFSSICTQLFNACQWNTQYATFVGGMMLNMLSLVDKSKNVTEVSTSLEENLSKNFPSIIENYNSMFNTQWKKDDIVNINAPARASNSHFATNKRLMSISEKKKRES